VPALKDGEIVVEKRLEALEVFLGSHLPLAVVGGVYQVVQDLVADPTDMLLILTVLDDLVDRLEVGEARPQHELEFTEH